MSYILKSIAITCFQMVYMGFVVVMLWRWFVMNIFPQLPALTLPQACGIVLMVSLLTVQPTSDDFDNDRVIRDHINFSVIIPTTALVLGWVVHLFL